MILEYGESWARGQNVSHLKKTKIVAFVSNVSEIFSKYFNHKDILNI